MILIDVTAKLVGDNVATFPALIKYSSIYDCEVKFGCDAILPIIPRELKLFNSKHSYEKVLKLDIHDMFHRYVHTSHMQEANYIELGVVPEPPIQLWSDISKDHSYKNSVIIAPHSVSDFKNNKLIPYEKWIPLLKELTKHYDVIVLGSNTDVKPWDIPGLKYDYGKGFDHVVSLIKSSAFAITLDTGISHIVQLIGTIPHLLFYPKCLPFVWVSNRNDNSMNVVIEPLEVTSEFMLDTFHTFKIRLNQLIDS